MRAKLDNVTVVLVGIRNSGNIGSAARAMKNMGVTQLALVNPAPYDTPEVYNLGWGAEDVIRGARVCESIEEAVVKCGFVVGATRRKGRHRRPVVDLRQALPDIVRATRKNSVAILFGREDKGLSNEELSLCQFAVSIPTSRLMSSLNVAQAVMILCYELFLFDREAGDARKFVPQTDLWDLYARLDRVLGSIGYGSKGDRKVRRSVMMTLKRIFGRSGLAIHEVDALHGLCQQVERDIERRGT